MKIVIEKSIDEMSTRELSYEILKLAALGVFVAGVFLAPSIAPAYRIFNPRNRTERQRLRRAFKRLDKEGKMRYTSKQRGDSALVTSLGKQTVSEEEFFSLTFTAPRKWNGEWFFVMFDIPNTHEKERNMFREKLREIGFVLYQDSVYVYPHDCKELIVTMSRMLGVRGCVKTLVSTKVDGENFLRKEFSLRC